MNALRVRQKARTEVVYPKVFVPDMFTQLTNVDEGTRA